MAYFTQNTPPGSTGGGARLPQWPAGQPNGGGVEMGREVGPVPPMFGGTLALRRQTARTQIPSNAGSNPPRHPCSATHQKKGGKLDGRIQDHCFPTLPDGQAKRPFSATLLHNPAKHTGQLLYPAAPSSDPGGVLCSHVVRWGGRTLGDEGRPRSA